MLASAGCVAPSPDGARAGTTSVAATSAGGPPPAPQTFTFDGLTPAYATGCAFVTIAGTCGAPIPPTSDFSRVSTTLGVPGLPQGVHVTIAWNATSPAERSMTLFVRCALRDTEESWVQSGVSPLTLDVRDARLASCDRIYAGLEGPLASERTAGPALVGLSSNAVDQPWRLDAAVTFT